MASLDPPRPQAPGQSALVVLVSGLPGVGKSTLIAALAPRLGAAVISRDGARATARALPRLTDQVIFRLFRRLLRRTQERAGNILLVHHQHLDRGDSVIVEAVAEPELRERLRDVCAQHRAHLVQLECVCDPLEHQRRISRRPKYWPGVVARIAAGYRQPTGCLTVDTSGRPAAIAESVSARLHLNLRTHDSFPTPAITSAGDSSGTIR